MHGCQIHTESYIKLYQPYGGGRQLSLFDCPKQQAPSPLRSGRCYGVRSKTGAALCGFAKRVVVSMPDLRT